MHNLKQSLEAVSETQEESIRPRLLAALRLGAEIALMRLRVVANGYVSQSDLQAVEKELDGIVDAPPPVTIPAAPVATEELVTL